MQTNTTRKLLLSRFIGCTLVLVHPVSAEETTEKGSEVTSETEESTSSWGAHCPLDTTVTFFKRQIIVPTEPYHFMAHFS